MYGKIKTWMMPKNCTDLLGEKRMRIVELTTKNGPNFFF